MISIDEIINKAFENDNSKNLTDKGSIDFKSVVNSKAKDLFVLSYKSKDDVISVEKSDEDSFTKALYQKWGHCFESSSMLKISIVSLAQNYQDYIANSIPEDEKDQKQYTYCCVNNLHARALQVFSEIMCLLKNGYPDAALARWRTLYE